MLVGHYCGVYVWVLPGCRDEFTKLTLAILDYASNQPAAILTKDVTINFAANGTPTTSNAAVYSIKATIPINIPSSSLLEGEATLAKPNHLAELRKGFGLPEAPHPQDQPLPIYPPEVFQNSTPPDFQFLNQRLQLLNPPR
jgi:hypothetical protein